jgi:tRNA nucleotidyltransferase (CCA-adding enzyme)
MDLILCHTTADFDALGAAVGLSRRLPGARIVLAGGAHPAVRDFLALYRDELALIERRAVTPEKINTIYVVDTQWRDRLGKTAEWLDLPQVQVVIYDHHPDAPTDIVAQERYTEAIGATTTLIVEQLQMASVSLTEAEATVMALGIHVDTGSLTYDHTTTRDALALAWLMAQGANLGVIGAYVDPGLSPPLQALLGEALAQLETVTIAGYSVAWVRLATPDYVPGLSSLASRLVTLTDSDGLLLGHSYQRGSYQRGEGTVLTVIGRSRIPDTDLNQLFQPWGGGGHAKAAALTLHAVGADATLRQLVAAFQAQIPPAPTARALMSSPVRTIRPETTIAEAQRILLRYGHSGLSVVNPAGDLVGVMARRDLDIAFHHGFSHAPVKGYMTTAVRTIGPETTLPEIEHLMVTYDIGRLPVLEQGQLVGIVTRTDVLRQLHRRHRPVALPPAPIGQPSAQLTRLAPPLQELLTIAAQKAADRGWHLYLVGGGVRDLLLTAGDAPVVLNDLDLVVDGYHRSAEPGAGMALAAELQALYPAARLEVHGKFQTAALLWHQDPVLDSLWMDIATARTEFYPYPAANPEVEAGSIQQDLYRRDFTINALALRLTQPQAGEMLDFFGGVEDLRSGQVRVLHPNSFIEDPTRIYRGVRFVVRLGFAFEPQTEGYIRHAIASGIYAQVREASPGHGRVVAPALQTRLKSELKYILQASYWRSAIQLLADLDALTCIHSGLRLDANLWRQLRLMEYWLQRFDPQEAVPHWQMLLEVLLAAIDPAARQMVAANLQLPAESIDRLANLAQVEAIISQGLPTCLRPSQVVQLLQPYDGPMLWLVGVRLVQRRQPIRQYLSHWSQVKPLLDGNDLQQLGYKPGKQFKPILAAVLAATLDGEIQGREGAIEFVREQFPTLGNASHDLCND